MSAGLAHYLASDHGRPWIIREAMGSLPARWAQERKYCLHPKEAKQNLISSTIGRSLGGLCPFEHAEGFSVRLQLALQGTWGENGKHGCFSRCCIDMLWVSYPVILLNISYSKKAPIHLLLSGCAMQFFCQVCLHP